MAVERNARALGDERVEGAVEVLVGLGGVEGVDVLLNPVGEDGHVDGLGGGHGGYVCWDVCVGLSMRSVICGIGCKTEQGRRALLYLE